MEYELKQNPAPNEWAVLIWKRVDGRKELDGTVTFANGLAEERANHFRDLMVALTAGIAQIVIVPESQRGKVADIQHK
jgi:hypothetical protein